MYFCKNTNSKLLQHFHFMGKDKLRKFKEVSEFKNCFFLSYDQSRAEGLPLKGKWNNEYFNNDNPIVLELGCGKGEYTVGLAQRYPNKNFIGVDLKGNRIWRGAKTALAEELNNVAFIRTRVDYIEACFEAGEVDEIWITFPDPQPQKSRRRARLTHPLFLNRYKTIIKKDGFVNLKTDSHPLYEYTLEVIEEENLNLIDNTPDLYAHPDKRDEALTNIKTFYEKLFSSKGFKINYVKFTF